MQSISYIALGSNLNHPEQQIIRALQALDGLPGSYLLAYSSFYQSAPMGPQDQPSYINAVAKLSTALSPIELLDALQKIEDTQGRKREKRWGARTIDLDIILYDHTIMQTERLILPHYGAKERDFVLLPLSEISPRLTFPDGESVQEALQHCQNYGLQKITIDNDQETMSRHEL
ncbi:2-amino-4-hydroxy-6-hydroxymethyldihydropteridine diphosphokinase [Kangiella sediminilitoris]|uniref:2-amino-4-hydroxy-6-hydroxymethyldihydropteridine pyrophosphokinase n=1 Tax=Kangiella sediminilitoris TaxID=1144748 RepID=A0A1B3BD91_9GAMM|nr:2-amino-4-hydroxy-6-hydroxymethyldihydropteridine diphosphokinase [Kangiella sediminilitoris]AOE50760.1 2-amino-4-hydroxy-6-hydroxymethyldihydropteridine pyrophosphokinase [Kangiella sediminilitoris]